ncbi:MAG: hypothetical protein KDD62_04380 [Bdellovibrionales bacterium]|nr:hypothetical protein [Bdellovibrionales bacterium]
MYFDNVREWEAMARRSKFQSKEIAYGDQKVVLYSIDGLTWSTRKDELEDIIVRHELERTSYGDQIKGGPQARVPTTRPKTSSVTPRRSAAHVAAQVSKKRDSQEEVEIQVVEPKNQKKAETKTASKAKSAPKAAPKAKSKSKAKTAPKPKAKSKAAQPKPRATTKAKSKTKSKAKGKKSA